MSDVKIKFEADLSKLNQALNEAASAGKKAAKGVKDPFDGILESEKKVERSIGNITRSLANMATPADAVASIMDNMENALQGSMMVGGAAAIGMALNQALNEAAKGMDVFSSKIEESMNEAFEASQEGLDKMQSLIDDLAADKADDGLFERLIFGGQKEELIASQEKALELAQRLVALKKEADSAEALTQSSRRMDAVRLRGAEFDENTFAGAEDKTRANEDASWIELQLKQYEELKKAQEEYNKILEDRRATNATKANYKEILDQVRERQQIEADTLEEQIRGARERRALERDLAEQARDNAIEQLAFMDERQKLHLNLEQSQEKLNTLSQSGAATEREIQDAKLAQLKAAADLEAWARKQIQAESEMKQVLAQRSVITLDGIAAQKRLVEIADEEAEKARESARTDEERLEAAKKMNAAMAEREKLLDLEIEQQKKLVSIDRERVQMAEYDPYTRAKNEAAWANEDAQSVFNNENSTPAEREQALLNVEKARKAVIDTAVKLSPSLEAIAGTDPESMEALSRAANRGGPSRFMAARQAQARYALAAAQRASDPYDATTQERAARTQRQAEIQEGQAKGYLDRNPDAADSSDWKTMPENKWQDFKRKAEDSAKAELDRKQQEKEAERERERDPIGDYKKRNKLGGEEEGEGEETPEKIGAEEAPGKGPEKPQDPMQQMANDLAIVREKIVLIEPRLPQNVLE